MLEVLTPLLNDNNLPFLKHLLGLLLLCFKFILFPCIELCLKFLCFPILGMGSALWK